MYVNTEVGLLYTSRDGTVLLREDRDRMVDLLTCYK